MANNNALATTLALPTSKTNWTAIVPARAAPPPPPTEQYPICEICADECVDYDDKLCHGCYHKSEGADECWCASAVDECLTDRARDALKRFAEEEEYICDCSVCGERLYACGSIELAEDADGGGCCAGCVCGEDEEDEQVCPLCSVGNCECDCSKCGVTGCFECVTGGHGLNEELNLCPECDNKLTVCEICGATPDITDDWHGNSVCDECFMCCEVCYDTKNPAVFEKTAATLCECEEKPKCDLCEENSDKCGKVTVLGMDITFCENCDKGGDGYDGFLDAYDYNPETNNYEEKSIATLVASAVAEHKKAEEVKKYKAVLSETLRYEAIMDMMKKC